MKKVITVILNYKVKDLTLKCVASVSASSYSNLEIIVVDNNSEDGLGKEITGVGFIQNQENLGFTGGNNIGIRQALKKGADYIFVLNPDTVVKKDSIEKLVSGLEQTNAGIAGPKIYFDNSETIWYAGGKFDLLNVLGSHRGVNEKDRGQYEKIEETDYVSGAAMMIKREVLEKVGLFDENFFLYYEDSDLCFRAKIAGFKIMYLPTAIVYHRNAQSTGLGSPLQDYYITRNRMLFASKFLPFRTRFALFREGVSHIDIPARRKALFDFLIGRLGKGNI